MSKNPWLADATNGATQQTYEIRTVADFFKVPEARRRICLREFHSWMAIQDGMTEIFLAVGEAMETPITRDQFHFKTEFFIWHDDGKATVDVTMLTRPPADDAVDPIADRDHEPSTRES